MCSTCWPISRLRWRRSRGRTGSLPGKKKSWNITAKLQAFLDFVLAQYVRQGVSELDQEKLGVLLQLKYHTIDDATAQLGTVGLIRDTFTGFQHYLYE